MPDAPVYADVERAAQRLQAARAAADSDRLLEAREQALEVLGLAGISPAMHRAAEELLGRVNIALVFSPRAMPEKEEYVVRPGDSLGKLAGRFGTTIDLLRKGNGISGTVIRIGDRLRILQGVFRVDVDVTRNELVLTLNDRFFKRYPVGTGKYQKTPVGTSVITDRIAQPTWWRPDGRAVPYGDPDNVLGTHWLSLDIRGYGIHGTWEPQTIGQHESAGCVRLLNTDIEELYTLLPVGTEVVLHKDDTGEKE